VAAESGPADPESHSGCLSTIGTGFSDLTYAIRRGIRKKKERRCNIVGAAPESRF
jgi:hypothetical protein